MRAGRVTGTVWMERMSDKDLEHEIDELLKAVGLDLLEFSLARRKGAVHVKAVIYSPQGTGTDECAKAHRLMLPRIQMSLGDQDPYIEVYSPGIDRVLRSEREWRAFAGKQVKYLLAGEAEWRSGHIQSFESGTVKIAAGAGVQNIPLASIVKAKLDSTHEGEDAHGI